MHQYTDPLPEYLKKCHTLTQTYKLLGNGPKPFQLNPWQTFTARAHLPVFYDWITECCRGMHSHFFQQLH